MWSDDQIGLLRSVIRSDAEGWAYHSGAIEASGEEALWGIGILWHGLFVEVCQRYFAEDSLPDITRKVASIRVQHEGGVDDIDPNSAEFLIRNALGDREADGDLADAVTASTQISLLPRLLADLNLDNSDREHLLSSAQERAERWI